METHSREWRSGSARPPASMTWRRSCSEVTTIAAADFGSHRNAEPSIIRFRRSFLNAA